MVKKVENLDGLLDGCPQNQIIGDNLVIAWSKINNPLYKKIVCSISGGADSDIVLDICSKCDIHNKIEYVWFDTGLEYQATKDHLKTLEEKYHIEIKSYKAIKPIPVSCKEYGQPFLSKYVSEMISRLQRHGFQWEDESFDTLIEKYPKCKIALNWWCNHTQDSNGQRSRFNIAQNKCLKEFMVLNHPNFKISNKCCLYAKKNVIHQILKDNAYDLSIMGIRRYEGGARSAAYKSCFDESEKSHDNYRPIFWYTDSDKQEYELQYGIAHSRCYTEYGLKRTGCAGCPFGKNFEFELDVIQQYEPKLYTAVNHIFRDSYTYTRKYREFCKEKEKKC